MNVGEYIVCTVGNPSRNMTIHSFWWRIHKLNVGEYTIFTIGNPLRNMRIHSFWRRIHKLNVGEYSFTIGSPLRNLRIYHFWVENTQVECWRIHSFHYREYLEETKNTECFGAEYTRAGGG